MPAFTSDYGGRLVDVLAMDVNVTASRNAVSSRQVPLSFGDTPKICTGIQKAVQAFLSCLLTRRGSCFRTDIGTSFLTDLQTRQPQTAAEVKTYYQLASSQAIAQANTTATADDERITEARLTAVALEPTRISMSIDVVTAAGERRQYVVPIEGV